MQTTNRRFFLMQVAASSTALAAAHVMAQPAPAKVDEKDPQAAALGYSSDTTKVDVKKFPKHTADQKCGTCQLYAGKPKEASGPCPIFGGKLVSANGWCSAYTKKA
ncbi:high-potential iron-sulfur protein [soil metagenome]